MAKIKLTNGIVMNTADSVASGLVRSGVAEYVAETEQAEAVPVEAEKGKGKPSK